MADEDNDKEDKAKMESKIGARIRNDQNKLDLSKVKDLAEIVGHCQVTKTKKKGFINISMRGTQGTEAMTLLEIALLREGKRQWDPHHPNPSTGISR